jgi:repressor LexA
VEEYYMYNDALAGNLKGFRLKRGWSQGDLATHSGVSRATVNATENGKGDLRFSSICKLACALGVAPHELVQSRLRTAEELSRLSAQPVSAWALEVLSAG